MCAADALAPGPNCLTPVHADVLQACLLAGCYHMGRRFLDERPVFQARARARRGKPQAASRAAARRRALMRGDALAHQPRTDQPARDDARADRLPADFYYAGMIAIGPKRYAEALDYLQTCVTASRPRSRRSQSRRTRSSCCARRAARRQADAAQVHELGRLRNLAVRGRVQRDR